MGNLQARAQVLRATGRMLNDLREGKLINNVNEHLGICTLLPRHYLNNNSPELALFHYEKREMFISWAHYSGNEVYPIPASYQLHSWSEDERMTHAVLEYDLNPHLWSGVQLEYRISLLEHMIAWLTARTVS
jgi:hypothetical protein